MHLLMVMTAPWFQAVLAEIAAGNIDPFNLKEDYEVLTGLTIGAEFWEEDFDTYIADLMRIVAAIG
jgi:hypothetical protein